MKTITTVPILLGLGAAVWGLSNGESVLQGLVCFTLAAVAGSMFLAFVYGWTKKSKFDSADVAAGIGRFGPVMVLWTCSLLYIAVVALVNATTTGTPIPFGNLAGH
jgi:hypothetical protein